MQADNLAIAPGREAGTLRSFFDRSASSGLEARVAMAETSGRTEWGSPGLVTDADDGQEARSD